MAENDLTAPGWTPAGFRLVRAYNATADSHALFEASAEDIIASGIAAGSPLPGLPGGRKRRCSMATRRWGLTEINLQRDGSYLMQLRPPSEVRYAAMNVHDCGHSIYTRGTKQQLQAAGIGVGIEFPGEPHANKRKCTVRESSGRTYTLTLAYRGDWCGDVPRYLAHETRSEHEIEQIKRATERRQWCERVARNGPNSPDEFRQAVSDAVKFFCSDLLLSTFTQGQGAYRFDLAEDEREALTGVAKTLERIARRASVAKNAALAAEIELCRQEMETEADTEARAAIARAKSGVRHG